MSSARGVMVQAGCLLWLQDHPLPGQASPPQPGAPHLARASAYPACVRQVGSDPLRVTQDRAHACISPVGRPGLSCATIFGGSASSVRAEESCAWLWCMSVEHRLGTGVHWGYNCVQHSASSYTSQTRSGVPWVGHRPWFQFGSSEAAANKRSTFGREARHSNNPAWI